MGGMQDCLGSDGTMVRQTSDGGKSFCSRLPSPLLLLPWTLDACALEKKVVAAFMPCHTPLIGWRRDIVAASVGMS